MKYRIACETKDGKIGVGVREFGSIEEAREESEQQNKWYSHVGYHYVSGEKGKRRKRVNLLKRG